MTGSTRVLDLLTGGWKAHAISSAVRVGVFDALGDQPANAARLAADLHLDEETLGRLLRLLEATGLVSSDPNGDHHLTDAGAVLTSDHPASLQPLVDLYHEPYFGRAWRELDSGLRSGTAPFEAAHAQTVFEYLSERPAASASYTSAIGAGAPSGEAILEAARLSSPRLVVDVGGGDGRLLSGLLSACPGSRGILLDRPDVVQQATSTLASLGLSDRSEAVGGDFFSEIPADGDVYLVSRVLHNWNDESCVTLLRAIRHVAAADARILVVERMIRTRAESRVDDVLSALFDLHMFVMTEGRERSEEGYARIAERAGLHALPSAALPMGFTLLALASEQRGAR